MSDFRTIVSIPKSEFEINYETNSFFIGSCFTQNIGEKLKNLKFPLIVNPFGVLYNPVSISNSLYILLSNKKFNETDLGFYNEKWYSFSHHTSFSNSDKNKCLEKINTEIENSSKFLKNTNILFITFGTARVYEYIKINQIVSNCHKIPAKEFNHKLLPVDQIVNIYSNLIQDLLKINKNLKIVFTVSPIRHWKDTAQGNLLSKSVLIVSIHKIIEKFKNCYYFPAYEIMMDDLRDYRFYDADMIHLNQIAIDYIWNRFSETYFNQQTKQIINEIKKIVDAFNHRPVDVNSNLFKEFAKTNLTKIKDLQFKYTFLNFNDELKYFENLV